MVKLNFNSPYDAMHKIYGSGLIVLIENASSKFNFVSQCCILVRLFV